MDWKSPRTEYAGPGASRARDPRSDKEDRGDGSVPLLSPQFCLRADPNPALRLSWPAAPPGTSAPTSPGPGSATCGQRGLLLAEGLNGSRAWGAELRQHRASAVRAEILGFSVWAAAPGRGVLVVGAHVYAGLAGTGDSGARALPSFAAENHLVLLPPRHRPSPFPRQVRAQTRECEHTPADTQRRSQASTWRRCRRWVVARVHRRREVLGTGIEPVPWAERVRSPGAALRPGAYELKKPGIIRANYTCAHSCRRGGRTGHPSRGLTPAILLSVGGRGVHRGAARKRQGGGPRAESPRRPELG